MDDFQIIHIDPISRRVTVKPQINPKKISGINKLIQIVVLALLTDPGRDVVDPDGGSGLPSLIGRNISSSDPTEIIAEVSERIEKIKEEILSAQSGLENEDPSERLSDLQILNVETGTQIDELLVKLRLVSEAGDSTTLIL